MMLDTGHRKPVIRVMRSREFGELDVYATLLQPRNIGTARLDGKQIVRGTMKQADRFFSELVVVSVSGVAASIECNVRRKPEPLGLYMSRNRTLLE